MLRLKQVAPELRADATNDGVQPCDATCAFRPYILGGPHLAGIQLRVPVQHDIQAHFVQVIAVPAVLDSFGVAVRAGHHCAQPVMTFFGIPATARASFGVYNTEKDVASLVAAIKKAREVFG